MYVEPYVEGDVYTVVGSISVDHDMDGGAVTPDIILNQDNMFYFSDSSLLGGASSSINATFKFFAETPESEVFASDLLWTTSPGTPHEYVLTADDVANGDITVVTAIVEYYDSVNDSYNVLGNGTYGGELSDGDITNMLWTPEFYDGTPFWGGEPFVPPADDGGDSGEPPVDDGGVALEGPRQLAFTNVVANIESDIANAGAYINTVSMDVVLGPNK